MDSPDPSTPITPHSPSLSDTEATAERATEIISLAGSSDAGLDTRNSLTGSPVIVSPPSSSGHSARSLFPTPLQLALSTPLPFEEDENPFEDAVSPTVSVSSELEDALNSAVAPPDQFGSEGRAADAPLLDIEREPTMTRSIINPSTVGSLSDDDQDDTDNASDSDPEQVSAAFEGGAQLGQPSAPASASASSSRDVAPTATRTEGTDAPKFTVIPPTPEDNASGPRAASRARSNGRASAAVRPAEASLSDLDLSGLSDEETDADADASRRTRPAPPPQGGPRHFEIFDFLDMLSGGPPPPSRGDQIRPQDRFEELTTSSDRTERDDRSKPTPKQEKSRPHVIIKSRPLQFKSQFGPKPTQTKPSQPQAARAPQAQPQPRVSSRPSVATQDSCGTIKDERIIPPRQMPVTHRDEPFIHAERKKERRLSEPSYADVRAELYNKVNAPSNKAHPADRPSRTFPGSAISDEEGYSAYARPSSTTSSIASSAPAQPRPAPTRPAPPPPTKHTRQNSFEPRILYTEQLAKASAAMRSAGAYQEPIFTRSPPRAAPAPVRPAQAAPPPPQPVPTEGLYTRPLAPRTLVSSLRSSLKSSQREREDDEASLPRPRPSLSPYELVRTIKIALDKDPVFYFTLKGVMTQFEEERAEKKAAARAEKAKAAASGAAHTVKKKVSRTASFRKSAIKKRPGEGQAHTTTDSDSDGERTEVPPRRTAPPPPPAPAAATAPAPAPAPRAMYPPGRSDDVYNSAASFARRPHKQPSTTPKDETYRPQRYAFSPTSPFFPVSENGSVAGDSDNDYNFLRYDARHRPAPPRERPSANPSRTSAAPKHFAPARPAPMSVAEELAEHKRASRTAFDGHYTLTQAQLATLLAGSVRSNQQPRGPERPSSSMHSSAWKGKEREVDYDAQRMRSARTRAAEAGAQPPRPHYVGRRSVLDRVPRRQAALYAYGDYGAYA